MKLDVIRFQFRADATNSLLFIDGEFECYTDWKTNIEMLRSCTRPSIPEGEYKIELRTEGGFHSRYC